MGPKSYAPVALFGYNRADHLEQTVQHLRNNDFADRTELYLFIDGPGDAAAEPGVEAVRRFARGIRGFESVTVRASDRNMGLRKSMIHGVTDVSRRHGRAIVVEDDIVSCKFFLRFMNEALDAYEDYPAVAAVSGYTPVFVSQKARLAVNDTFFHYRANCWGWATWWSKWGQATWEPADWETHLANVKLRSLISRGGSDMPCMLEMSMDGRNSSWMARWYFNNYLRGELTLYPGVSLVNNIGFDGSGTHSRNSGPLATRYRKYMAPLPVLEPPQFTFALPVAVDPVIHRTMKQFWDMPWYVESALARTIRPYYRRVKTALGLAR